jgi:iron-sulfur cluster assembly protein
VASFDFIACRKYKIIMFHITQIAAVHLRALLEEKAATPDQGLRLAVERGGCAGMQYNMEIGTRTDTDSIFGEAGATVLIDAESHAFLDGSTLDYVDELTGSGFKIINPRAARSCGCGTSFEPEPEAAATH